MSSVELADLEQIVLTVSQEYDRLRGGKRRKKIGRFQRFAFLLLRLVAFSIPVALALFLLVVYLGKGGTALAFLLLLWPVVALVLLLPLTLINLPLIIVAWQQRRPIVGRDLLVPAFPAWQRKLRWAVLAVTVGAALLAAFVPAVQWDVFVLVLLVITLPFSLFVLQSFLKLAERNLSLLRDVEELKEVLEDKLSQARREQRTEVDVPHEVAVRLSETTSGIFRNQKIKAIGDMMRTPSTKYSVSQSSTFRERLRALEPAKQLALLDRMNELAANRQPAGAHRDESSGYWIWKLESPPIHLVYEVADEQRQVKVRDARSAPATGRGDPEGRG